METNLKEIVLDLLEKENEIVLTVGENDYYIDNGSYSVTLEYTLEKAIIYSDDNYMTKNGYSFKILSVYVICGNDTLEVELYPDKEITYAMFENAEIEDWSDDFDGVLDDFLERNY